MTQVINYENYIFFKFIPTDSDKHNLTMKLGNYVSHEILGKDPKISLLNSIDRRYHAELFLDKFRNYFKYNNKSVYDSYTVKEVYCSLIDDIALFIDLRIPYSYYKKTSNLPNNDVWRSYRGIESVEGKITYQFKKSISLEEKFYNIERPIEKATEKQKKYLNALAKNAGYNIVNEQEITKEIASKLIGFFKEDKELDVKLQNKYLIYE